MEEKLDKIDALLISDFYNKKYISHFTGSTSEVILTKSGKNIFVTDGRYKLQIEEEIDKNLFEIYILEAGEDYFNKLIQIVKEKKFTSLGIEENKLTVDKYKKLQKEIPNIELKLTNNIIENMRLVKQPEEIAKIKAAIAITDQMFIEIKDNITEGISEKELARLIDNKHLELGGEYPSFDTIVAFGDNTAKPHAKPSKRKLKKGDIITIDCGVFKNGYCSDMTRTFFYNFAKNEEIVKIWNAVLETNKKQTENIFPGKKCSEIDKIGRDYLEELNYKQYFNHGTGHGIGLEIHENPLLNAYSNKILKPGMIITVEPGVYIDQIGGVRIENDILVTENGYEVLTKSPIEMIIK